MKLLVKTSLYYIGLSIIGFIIGGFIFYNIIYSVVNKRTNEDLKTEVELIEDQIIHSDSLPDFTPYFGHQIIVTVFNQKVNPTVILRDTVLVDTTTDEAIPARYLISTANKNGKSYSIELLKPLFKTNQLISNIFAAMFVMFLFLLLSLILINYLISKKTWSPFYYTLKQIKEYDISQAGSLNLSPASTTEFRQLNQVLTQMSRKINHNYINLKEFTENAAHEIQTPLAIIKSKLELLIQSQPLTKEQLNLVQSMYNAVNKLSKLNSNLVLLSKIENSQYNDMAKIDLAQLIDSTLVNFEDLIQQKNLKLQKSYPDLPVILNFNSTLAEVLIVNLISNAIKHNVPNGTIKIELTENSLVISNTGQSLEIDPKMLFGRFKKGRSTTDSLGLGLSIVQKIASVSDLDISYLYDSGVHTLILKF